MGCQGKALTGVMAKPLVRRLGLVRGRALETGRPPDGPRGRPRGPLHGSGWTFKAVGSGELQALVGSGHAGDGCLGSDRALCGSLLGASVEASPAGKPPPARSLPDLSALGSSPGTPSHRGVPASLPVSEPRRWGQELTHSVASAQLSLAQCRALSGDPESWGDVWWTAGVFGPWERRWGTGGNQEQGLRVL